MAIFNDDKIDNFLVCVYAKRNVVNCFQVRDLPNARIEANRIRANRAAENLPTTRIAAWEVINKDKGTLILS